MARRSALPRPVADTDLRQNLEHILALIDNVSAQSGGGAIAVNEMNERGVVYAVDDVDQFTTTLGPTSEGQVLRANASLVPSWGVSSVDLASSTGVLPVPNGGTGRSALTAGALLVGNGIAPVNLLSPGADGQYLRVSAGAFGFSGILTADLLPGTFGGAGAYTFPDDLFVLGTLGVSGGGSFGVTPTVGGVAVSLSNHTHALDGVSITGVLPPDKGGTGLQMAPENPDAVLQWQQSTQTFIPRTLSGSGYLQWNGTTIAVASIPGTVATPSGEGFVYVSTGASSSAHGWSTFGFPTAAEFSAAADGAPLVKSDLGFELTFGTLDWAHITPATIPNFALQSWVESALLGYALVDHIQAVTHGGTGLQMAPENPDAVLQWQQSTQTFIPRTLGASGYLHWNGTTIATQNPSGTVSAPSGEGFVYVSTGAGASAHGWSVYTVPTAADVNLASGGEVLRLNNTSGFAFELALLGIADIDGLSTALAGTVSTSGSYADPAWITSLSATKLTGTVASGRIAGIYTGITGVGTITAGTWQGTAIAAAYVGNLPTSKITSGTFDNARISQSNVTQHQSALSIAVSQLSGEILPAQGGTGLPLDTSTADAILQWQQSTASFVARTLGSSGYVYWNGSTLATQNPSGTVASAPAEGRIYVSTGAGASAHGWSVYSWPTAGDVNLANGDEVLRLNAALTGFELHTLTASDVGAAASTHTHSNISVLPGNGLTGGGALSANVTLTVGALAGVAGSRGTVVVQSGGIGVTLGTTSTTAAAGNHTHTAAQVGAVSSTDFIVQGRSTADVNTFTTSGTYGLSNTNLNKPPNNYMPMWVARNNDVGAQLAILSNTAYFRSWGNSGSTWNPWYEIYHSGNTHTHAYGDITSGWPSITAGTGLTGGGSLSASRTLNVDLTTIASVSYVDGALAGKANSTHTHDAADITNGTLDYTMIPRVAVIRDDGSEPAPLEWLTSVVWKFQSASDYASAPPGTGTWSHLLTVQGWTGYSASYPTQQLAFRGDALSIRRAATSTTWASWRQIAEQSWVTGAFASLTGSYADPAWITSLSATKLTGTVASGRIAGSYTGITGVGTISTGTWQGSAIADTYLAGLTATKLTGTIASARISGSYTGITGVGTITAGTWQGTAIANTYISSVAASKVTAGDFPSGAFSFSDTVQMRGGGSSSYTSAGTLALKTAANNAFISWHNSAGTRLGYIQFSSSLVRIAGETAVPMLFDTNGAGTNRMRIEANGNVEIGYSGDQGYKLAVSGTGYFSGNVTVAGTLTAAGGFDSTVVSLRRYKYGVDDFALDRDALRAARPRQWTWAQDELVPVHLRGRWGAGFVEDELPDAFRDHGRGYRASHLLAQLTAGWQEHDRQIETNTQRIERLESENAALRAQLAAMRN